MKCKELKIQYKNWFNEFNSKKNFIKLIDFWCINLKIVNFPSLNLFLILCTGLIKVINNNYASITINFFIFLMMILFLFFRFKPQLQFFNSKIIYIFIISSMFLWFLNYIKIYFLLTLTFNYRNITFIFFRTLI